MDPVAGSKEQMVAAAAAAALAASGQRARNLTAEDLASLCALVRKSVVKLEKKTRDGVTVSFPGTIIAATATYCYVLLHTAVGNCEIVFPADGARVRMNKADFVTTTSHLSVAKINHGSMIPVRFTQRPVSFFDSVYLYVREGRGLTPGSVVNPTGESKPSHFVGNFFIDNAPDFAASFGAPVFDDAGEFLGVVVSRPSTCFAMGVSKIKEILRQKLPPVALAELTSLNVL